MRLNLPKRSISCQTLLIIYMNKDILKSVSNYLLKSWNHVLLLDEISEENEINNPNHYEDKRHFRNGISNAKKEYYKTYGNYHREIKKLLEYTIKEKYLKCAFSNFNR